MASFSLGITMLTEDGLTSRQTKQAIALLSLGGVLLLGLALTATNHPRRRMLMLKILALLAALAMVAAA